MNFTIHQLRIFYKVYENQSITKTAEELFLSQPAVSIQLKKFQEQFSIPLTELVGRQLYITDFGNEVAKAAEEILNKVDLIRYKTLQHQGELIGKLKISVVSTGKYVMPYFLTKFMQTNPGVDLTMDVTNKLKVIDSIDQNKVDFALVSVIPDQFKTNNIELMKNELYLVGSSIIKRPKSEPKKAIFTKYPLLYREQGSATRAAMEEFLQKNNFSTHKQLELTSNEALKQAAMAGLGFSIIPLIGIKNELHNGSLEIIPYKGLPIVTNWSLIWLKSKNLSPVAEAFLKYIVEQKENIISEHFTWMDKLGL